MKELIRHSNLWPCYLHRKHIVSIYRVLQQSKRQSGVEVTEEEIEEGACQYAGNGVDGIMGLDVEGAEEEQDGKWEETIEEPAVATLPCQPHHHHRHADMTTGEGCRGALAGIVGELQDMIEEAVGITWDGQRELRVEYIELEFAKVIVDIGKDTGHDLIDTHYLEIELRSGYRQ